MPFNWIFPGWRNLRLPNAPQRTSANVKDEEMIRITSKNFYRPWCIFASIMLIVIWTCVVFDPPTGAEFFRTVYLWLTPLGLFLTGSWLWAAFTIKEVYYRKDQGLVVEYKGKRVEIPFRSITSFEQIKRPAGMPIKVSLLEPREFGTSFYFAPKFLRNAELREIFKDDPRQTILSLLEAELKKA